MYQSPEWFDHLRVMGRSSELSLAVARDAAGRLLGVVPLRLAQDTLDFHVSGNTLGTIPIRKLFFLGGRPMAPLDPDQLDQLFRAADEAFPQAQSFGFPALEAGDAFWQYLTSSPVIEDHFFLYVVDSIREYHLLSLAATFEEYLAQYSAKKRYNLRRQVRILREHGGGRLELRRIQGPEDVDDYVEARAALARAEPRSSWSRREPIVSEQDVRNLRSVAQAGLLRSYVLRCGGEPIGCIRGNHYQGNYLVARIQYRQDLARFSPGVVMLHLAIEDLIAHGPTRLVNFGFGEPNPTHHRSNVVLGYGSALLLRRTLANRLRWSMHRSFRETVQLAKQWSQWGRRPSPEGRGLETPRAAVGPGPSPSP
jgi:CelD/BcsL family acetyltransferase involved in cellulose biosynthesis